MSKIDQTLVLGSSTIEFHVGNGSGSTGQNALPPVDAPSNPPRVVIAGTGKPLSVTVGSTRFQNPA